MADCFMKNIKKKTGRAKETILESLGKADRTNDQQFQDLNANFNKQQKNVEKLQHELKTFVMSMKVANQALLSVHDVFRDVYETEWGSKEEIQSLMKSNERAWFEFLANLNDDALVPVNDYVNKFVEQKAKIAKRGRKLVDYDSARHSLTTVENSPKKTDDKVHKAYQQLATSKKLYEDINNELISELPKLFDSRIDFIINHFQSLYAVQASFLQKTAEITNNIRDELKLEHVPLTKFIDSDGEMTNGVTKSYDLHGSPPSFEEILPPPPPIESDDSVKLLKYTPSPDYAEIPVSTVFQQNGVYVYPSSNHASDDSVTAPRRIRDFNKTNTLSSTTANGDNIQKQLQCLSNDAVTPVKEVIVEVETGNKCFEERGVDVGTVDDVLRRSFYMDATEGIKEEVDVKINEKTTTESKNYEFTVLCKVRATHSYKAEDVDELSFEIGDVISVIPYSIDDDVDEGWQMGLKEETGEKGIFPLNFTKNL